MQGHPIEVFAPVFLVVAGGYLFGPYLKLEVESLSELIIKVLAPCLLLSYLSSTKLTMEDSLVISSGGLFVVAGVGLTSLVILSLLGLRQRGLFLPCLFMNSGNMGLPLALLAFGDQGMQRALIFFVTMTVLNYSFGIWLAKGRGGLREVFSLSLIYAAVIGIGLTSFQVRMPEVLFKPLSLLGQATIPLMLITLGYQLRSIKVSHLGVGFLTTLLRIGGGLMWGLLFVKLFSIQGLPAKVIVLEASMPSAVVNLIFSQRYHCQPEAVASSVFVSTVASFLSVPLVLSLLNTW